MHYDKKMNQYDSQFLLHCSYFNSHRFWPVEVKEIRGSEEMGKRDDDRILKGKKAKKKENMNKDN